MKYTVWGREMFKRTKSSTQKGIGTILEGSICAVLLAFNLILILSDKISEFLNANNAKTDLNLFIYSITCPFHLSCRKSSLNSNCYSRQFCIV